MIDLSCSPSAWESAKAQHWEQTPIGSSFLSKDHFFLSHLIQEYDLTIFLLISPFCISRIKLLLERQQLFNHTLKKKHHHSNFFMWHSVKPFHSQFITEFPCQTKVGDLSVTKGCYPITRLGWHLKKSL